MDEPSEKLEYLNISADESGLCEYEDGKRLVWLPISDIKSLSHGYGNLMRFPIVAFLLGLVLIASGAWFGLLPLYQAIITHQNYGFSILKGFGLISLHIYIGYWLINTSFSKSNYVLAETNSGPVKLKIRGEIDEELLRDFLTSVRNKLGAGVS